MKKRHKSSKTLFLVLILSLLTVSSICAAEGDYEFSSSEFFLAPFSSSNIDLSKYMYYHSPTLSTPPNESEFQWTKFDMMVGDDSTTPNTIEGDRVYTSSKTHYTDKNMVALGGFSSYITGKTDAQLSDLRKRLQNATLNISVFTDSGQMELISQSNNAYRWPFEFFVVVKTSSTKQAGENQFITIMEIDETSRTFTTPKLTFLKEGYSSGSAVYFDFIIAFPIDSFDEDNMTLKSGNKTYYIAEKDDYTAMVTISFSLEEDGKNLGSGTLTIPFSGFYQKSTSTDTFKSYASLSVLLNAAASTLDLKRESGELVKIGEIDLMANYYNSPNDNITPPSIPNHVHLFLSSSSNPELAGDKFRFIKVGETIPTVANSLPFKLSLVGVDGYYENTKVVEFDGTDKTPVPNTDYHSDYAEAKKIIIKILTYPDYEKPQTYFQYTGELYIETDRVQSTLAAGTYQEDVYVHVFSD